MAIGFQTSATGTKTTTGTTFTISLASHTAGDLVVVGVVSSTVSTTVSSITDGSGNAYHQVNTVLSGTLRASLWKTDAVNPVGGALTLTVTLSASGSNCAGVAASYRAVSFAGTTGVTAGPTTSGTLTSGSVTLSETNGWVVFVGGQAAANTFTAQNGSLRNQVAGTTVNCAFIDSNDAASPATCSATMTSASWVGVRFELRLLEATQLEAAMSQTDRFIAERQLQFVDGSVISWNDALVQALPVVLPVLLSDTNVPNLKDGPVSEQNSWTLSLICPHLGDNWTDARVTVLGLNEVLSDSNVLNWADLYQFNLQVVGGAALTLSLSDTDGPNWADFMGAGYGNLNSDQIIFVDSISAGYGGSFSDQLVMSDAEFNVLSMNVAFSDQDTTWLDFMMAGYGAATSDQLIMVDSLGAGYGGSFSDQLVMTDAEQNLMAMLTALSDQLVLTDSFLSLMSIAGLFSDQMNTMTDSEQNLLGMLKSLSDQLVMTDVETNLLGTLASFSDQIVMTDALMIGYGNQLTDSMNNWADFVGASVSVGLQLVDSLAATDNLAMGYGNIVTDQMTMSDVEQNLLGMASSFSDQIVMTDSEQNLLGMNVLLSDQDTTWLDQEQHTLGINQLTESLSDQMTMTDFMGAGYGASTSDQIILVDSLGTGYGALLTDSDTFWNDSLSGLLSIAEVLSDQMTMTDFMLAGYGAATSDQIILTDSISAGYGGQFSDQMTLTDSELANMSFLTTFSDQMVLTDSERNVLGLGTAYSDQMTLTDSMLAGYGMVASDQLVILDSQSMGYGFLLSDQDNFWADSFVATTGGGTFLSLSDQLVMSDFMAAGYGHLTSDQIIIVDSITAGYGAQLTDQDTNWADSITEFLTLALSLSDQDTTWLDRVDGGEGFGLSFTDTFTMADFMMAGYGAATSDQIILVDSIASGYGAQLSDQDNFWADSIQSSISVGLSLADQDTTWTDRLGLGYGNLVVEQMNTMADFMTAGYGAGMSDQIILSDSLAAGYGALLSDQDTNWADSILVQPAIALMVSDTDTTWADRMRGAYVAPPSDQIIFIDSSGPTYEAGLHDQLVMSDTFAYFANLPNLQLNASDQLVLTDYVALGYGVLYSDQVVLVDSIGAGYGPQLSDQMNTLTDFERNVLGLQLLFVDQDTTFADNVSFEMQTGIALVDVLSMADRLGLGHGLVISDTASLQDSLRVGYGFLFTDDEGPNWADNFDQQHGTFIGINLHLTDQIAQFWMDNLDLLLISTRGPLLMYGAIVHPEMTFKPNSPTMSVNMALPFYATRSRVDTTVSNLSMRMALEFKGSVSYPIVFVPSKALLQETGTGHFTLEDGTGIIILEDQS